MVLPRMQPAKRRCKFSFISRGSHQLFVGPASSFFRTDVGALFDARYIIGMRMAPEATRALCKRHENAGLHEPLGHMVKLFRRSITEMYVRGNAETNRLFDPRSKAA